MQINCYGRIIYQIKSYYHGLWPFGKVYFKLWLKPYFDNFDIITIEKSDNGVELTCNDDEYQRNNNGIIKAVNHFFTLNNELKQNIDISLQKNGPPYSGLEYSSSHAVNTFILLHRFYKVNMNDEDLYAFASLISYEASIFVKNEPIIVNTHNFRFKRPHPNFLPEKYEVILTKVVVDEKLVVEKYLNNCNYYRKQNNINHANIYRNTVEMACYDSYDGLHKQYNELLKKGYVDVLLVGFGEAFLCWK